MGGYLGYAAQHGGPSELRPNATVCVQGSDTDKAASEKLAAVHPVLIYASA